MPSNTNEIGKLLSTNSPSVRPGKQIWRFFFGAYPMIHISRLFIQVLYSAKICEHSKTRAPLRVPQSNRYEDDNNTCKDQLT
jgi:hypothetical protein